jgi:fanconi-associated nuclease 1
MLNIPMSERHKCDGQLKKAQDVYIEGVRVKDKAKPSFWNKFGRGAKGPLFSTQSRITEVCHIRPEHPSDSLCELDHRPTRT